jgi:hypothetical protein
LQGTSFQRYAIYWVPRPDSALAAFARRWFGSDVETGTRLTKCETFGLSGELAERATASPGRYGIHATIKAPFRLHKDAHQDDFFRMLGVFCAKRRAPRAGKLKIHRFSRYLTLVPANDTAELDWLAAECVTHFDTLRAPLNDADRLRRAVPMDPVAAANFEQFGYPDIFDRFMFHITLAGPLEPADLEVVEAALAPSLAAFTETPFVAADLCVCGDPGDRGLFRVLYRHSFGCLAK